ncbi:unnamed protein product [Prunus armeniaca]
METQLGQIVDALSQREPRKFLSQLVILQRNQKQAKVVITLRSGPTQEENEKLNDDPSNATSSSKAPNFHKAEKNLTLLPSHFLEDLPKASRIMYEKFFKELNTYKRKYGLNEKRKYGPNKKVMVSENVSHVLQRKLPPKLKDPGMYLQLGLGDLKATTISLQLANRIVRYPRVLDMEEAPIHDRELPILLGRPFMATTKTVINVQSGLLTMTVLGETFLLAQSNDPLQYILSQSRNDFDEESALMEMVAALEALKPYPSTLSPLIEPLEPSTSDLTPFEEDKLIRVLKEFKSSVGWSIADIKGISPTMCMHQILLKEGAKSTREPQKRLNPHMKEVVRAEVLKLLDVGIIYSISDSKWVSAVQVVPKRIGIIVFLVLLLIIVLTSPVLQRCQETNLIINWEKCQFMVKQGVVLGHVRSNKGIEVDKGKIDIISNMAAPTSMKGVRSFLGYAGFYRRFIKDFFKITHLLCNLLAKDVVFHFDKDCMIAFNTLKRELTSAPIIMAPDWSLAFELMCDASDYAIGAILG